MKKGTLKLNKMNDRYGIWDGENWLDSGFHCGETLEILINKTWVPTRMEMSWEDDGNKWYLVGTGFAGNLDGIIAKVQGVAVLSDVTETKKVQGLEVKSMTELYDETYPPRLPIVEGLINCGSYIFAGSPKIGKSFFMLQLGYHVATGTDLWDYPVRQGTVLYLALEDNYERLQQRLAMMYGEDVCDSFFLTTKSKGISEGLCEQMETFVTEHPDTRLIIIDTLQKVRDQQDEAYNYRTDYDTINGLKEFSDKHSVCILIVHHTRKLEAVDNFDMISGSNGLFGSADGAFMLIKKKRTDKDALLCVVGRDQQDQEFTLQKDYETCIWKKVKSETEIFKPKPDVVLGMIADFITADNPLWEGTASELMEVIPELKGVIKANALVRKLNTNNTRLYRECNVRYEQLKRTPDRKPFSLKYVCDDEK